ncbi:hypothetical protein [Kribbella sp. NPDC051620]|uniref:hypothetical protein n=1 Tax=Kribbella sp. NPDC051620 TaxID=3364120 RepID=UPI0037A7E880
MNWLLRARRSRWLVPVFLGVAALALAGGLMATVVDEYDVRAILKNSGQQATVTVTEVTAYSRTKESLAVRAALPDGRLVDVDFADSNQLGATVGEPVQVTIDPNDISISIPTDQLNNGQSFASGLVATSGLPVLFAVGCFVFAFIRAKEAAHRTDR